MNNQEMMERLDFLFEQFEKEMGFDGRRGVISAFAGALDAYRVKYLSRPKVTLNIKALNEEREQKRLLVMLKPNGDPAVARVKSVDFEKGIVVIAIYDNPTTEASFTFEQADQIDWRPTNFHMTSGE